MEENVKSEERKKAEETIDKLKEMGFFRLCGCSAEEPNQFVPGQKMD